MAFVEDFVPFFADFGVSGTLAQQSTTQWPGDPIPFEEVPVKVIFDEPVADQDGIMLPSPQAQIASADVMHYILDALLTIPQGVFKVREAIPDGTGLTLLVLTRVS